MIRFRLSLLVWFFDRIISWKELVPLFWFFLMVVYCVLLYILYTTIVYSLMNYDKSIHPSKYIKIRINNVISTLESFFIPLSSHASLPPFSYIQVNSTLTCYHHKFSVVSSWTWYVFFCVCFFPSSCFEIYPCC